MRLGRWDAPDPRTFFAEVARCGPCHAQTAAGADDDAVILFTSGTSARPKGVVLTYREHLANIDPAAEGFGITADDRLYDFRSFNWASAQLLGALVPVSCGATLVMATKFSASRFFRHIRDHRVTVAAGNPTTINILLNAEADAHRDTMPTLRFLTSSSAPLTIEEWRRFEERFGIPIAQGYGSSETGWIAAIPGEQRRLGTVGRPFAYHHLTIVDADGRPLPPGETGQIEIGGVEIGGHASHDYRYLADDGSVKVHSRGRIRTGDLGRLDVDGYLRLTGREKDLIIRGGVNISPVEIDSFLMRHPKLIDVATIGVPDAIYGEEVVSYVVARPGATVDELLRYCSDGLPAFKAPKQIVLSATLPKTERGKLDRRALAERWRGANSE
jgi:acyl-coenzyme A synthetase/AMP-(fatty) acid ligase